MIRLLFSLVFLAASLAGCAIHGVRPATGDATHAAAKKAPSHRGLNDGPTSQTPADTRSLVRVGRYSTAVPKPTREQSDLLLTLVRVEMPPKVDSVGEAVRYLLRRSGFQLAQENAMQPEVVQILGKPLPQVHRRLGPMTLEDALSVLVGPAFRLDVDHVHRVVNFRLIHRRETGSTGFGNAQSRVAMPAKHG